MGIAWWATLFTACALLLAPLLLVDVPPLLDYPNHLARAYVLAFGARDPVVAAMYAPHWAVIPNLAIDLVLPPLLRVLPVHVAGRAVLAITLLLPVFGAILYHRAVFRRRAWWPLAVVLVAPNGLFLLGFVNFQISVGLALVCAAAWLRARQLHPVRALMLGAASTVPLFFAHMLGLLFFLLLLATEDLAAVWRAHLQRTPPLKALARRAAWSLPILAPAALLYALSPLSHASGDSLPTGWPEKLFRAAEALINYSPGLDILSVLLLGGFLLACALRSALSLTVASILALAATFILFLIAPDGIKGGGFLDARLAVMFGLLLFATIQPRLPQRASVAAFILFAALFCARTATLAAVWSAHANDLAQLRLAIAPVPAGARVLLAAVEWDDADPAHRDILRRQTLSDGTRLDLHTAALLLIERRAFWTFLFTDPDQQPVALREPYLALGEKTLGIPDLHLLNQRAPSQADRARFPIVADWWCCYDYVLLMQAGARPGFTHDHLSPLVQTDFAALYRIHP